MCLSQTDKVFCFFFSKKEVLPYLLPLTAMSARGKWMKGAAGKLEQWRNV
jgi:hypothetical protein